MNSEGYVNHKSEEHNIPIPSGLEPEAQAKLETWKNKLAALEQNASGDEALKIGLEKARGILYSQFSKKFRNWAAEALAKRKKLEKKRKRRAIAKKSRNYNRLKARLTK